jgi:hypothetical protein
VSRFLTSSGERNTTAETGRTGPAGGRVGRLGDSAAQARAPTTVLTTIAAPKNGTHAETDAAPVTKTHSGTLGTCGPCRSEPIRVAGDSKFMLSVLFGAATKMTDDLAVGVKRIANRRGGIVAVVATPRSRQASPTAA